MPKSIYMDYAASAEPNPSSIHEEGIKAKKQLEEARNIVSEVLHARPEEILFTSGGTESNNLAIQGVVWAIFEKHAYPPAGGLLCSARRPAQGISKIATPRPGSIEEFSVPAQGISKIAEAHPELKDMHLPHIITTNIEHPSVLETVKMLEERNLAEVSIVPVEENGIVDPKKIKKEIKENTVLVSVMYANNEIGTIQPIKEIAKEIRHWQSVRVPLTPKRSRVPLACYPLFHVDAVQAANYLDLNVEKLGVDLLSISGTKIPGAGRVGVLFKRKSASLAPLFGGGDQEAGLRPGTENLPEILKFTKAFVQAEKIKEKEVMRLTKLRDYFIGKLKKDFILNGDQENRLPNNVNITIPKIPSDLLVIELSARGIMTSEKSACKSGEKAASHVIAAICQKNGGKSPGALRFSFGKETKKADIDRTLKALFDVLTKLRKWYY